jgi:putative DNA methylase
MRALVFASLCKDTSEVATGILKQLSFSDSEETFAAARKLIATQYTEPPRLLDMFGGGGTIPSEALNIGAETYALDANELSVFIQRCNLIYSQQASARVSEILEDSGRRILSQLTEETERLFPLRKKALLSANNSSPFGYIWTYVMACRFCGYKFYLSKRRFLSKKREKSLALVSANGAYEQTVFLKDGVDDEEIESVWLGRNGTVQCPKCKEKHSGVRITDCEDSLVAIVKPAERRGKEFYVAPVKAVPSSEEIAKIEAVTLQSLSAMLPSSPLPEWSGIVNPAIYGIKTHADFLNRRQRVVLLLLIKALRDEYERLALKHSADVSRYVIGMLSSMIDQLVDWNCRLSMWIPQNEQVGRAFCGPGVSMLWDYVETDPVLKGPANLWAKLDRIIAGAQSIKRYSEAVTVQRGYAQELPYEDEFFDAIVTDPPYYDNIYYNVLADFFFSWKRLLLSNIEPDLFRKPITDSTRELVASKFRSKTTQQAHEDYCTQLTLAMREAERVLKPDGIFSFVYSHSSLRGWEAIVRAYRATNFRITSVQPLSIERKQRPRAMTSEAVNTCITFVAYKANSKKTPLSINRLQIDLRKYVEALGPQLLAVNWNETDTALAVFAHGVAMLANSEKVSGVDDMEALRRVEEVVKAHFPSFKVSNRKSL